jgi:chromosome segregation ATPase
MSYRALLIAEINQLEKSIEEMQKRIQSLEQERNHIGGQIDMFSRRINDLKIKEMEESLKEEQDRQLLQG